MNPHHPHPDEQLYKGASAVPHDAENFRRGPHDPEEFRTVPKDAEDVGNIQNYSERFGKVQNDAESFRTVPKTAERSEHHVLTVREVTRIFEEAGVPRSERSIVNWCRENRYGLSRLDAFFDQNERKYFITRESVVRAIEEERAKSATGLEIDGRSEGGEKDASHEKITSASIQELETLELKVRDLEITNRAKDYFIEQLQKEREAFGEERQNYVNQLMTYSREVGELKTQLLQIESADSHEESRVGERDNTDSLSDAS